MFNKSKKYDVIIAGGGTAGVIAAIASARYGAKTLLLERWGHLGGTAVYGIPFLATHDSSNNKVCAGIAEELIERLVNEKGSVGYSSGANWADEKHAFSLTPFEPEIYKYAAQEMVLGAGADILFHTSITDALVKNGSLTGVRVFNKSGYSDLSATIFVDCTGDADLAYFSGVPMQPKSSRQNVSMLFKMANVDMERFTQALEKGRGVKGFNEWHTRIIRGKALNDPNNTTIHLAGHFAFGDGTEKTFTAISQINGEVYINATRTTNINGADACDLNMAEILERRNVHEITKKLIAQVPGFEKAHLIYTSPVGIRESRNISGEYTLTKEDVVEGKDFHDTVARGAYPIDIHDPKGGRTQFTFIKGGGSYGIPYRCMLPEKIDGLIVCGRCLSATHEATGTARIMGTVMCQGEAAGTAAAMSAAKGIKPRELSAEELRKVLLSNGVIL